MYEIDECRARVRNFLLNQRTMGGPFLLPVRIEAVQKSRTLQQVECSGQPRDASCKYTGLAHQEDLMHTPIQSSLSTPTLLSAAKAGSFLVQQSTPCMLT